MYSLEEQVMCCAWAIAYENTGKSQLMFTEKYNRDAPSRSQINYWKQKLLETGSLSKDRPRSGRPVTSSGDENQALIRNQINENPHTSVRQIASNIDVPTTSVYRCLQKSKMKPYKASCCQILTDGDDDKRLEFCEIMIERSRMDPAFLRKLVFSDECNFYCNGNINKHNTHYWAEENPHWRLECKTHYTRYLTVWAAIGWNGVIGLDISEQTMNGARYCKILNEHVVPYFQRNPTMIFQQDGASPHYAIEARQILDERLPGRWLGRRGPTEWPARSPDLTPCDYWLWPYVKSLVFINNRQFETLDSLREVIQKKINDIPLKMFRDSMRNYEKRIRQCRDSEGGVFE